MIHPADKLKKLLTNRILQYIFSRYATYFIQFVNSLFIAVNLGPYYLGIWGFVTLVLQYMNEINLGIAHAVNAIISIHRDKGLYVFHIVGAALTMLVVLSLLVALFFVGGGALGLDIGSKYDFARYAPFVIVTGILGYFNTLLSHVFRAYGRVTEIAFNQSAFPVLMLFTILLFRGKNLLWALVLVNLTAFILSLAVYLLRSPIRLKPLFSIRLGKVIQKKGWHLFIYNTSFLLIMITTRSFISAFYEVDEFGYFTFAFGLANVVLLLLQSLAFLIYPKLINRMAKADAEQNANLLSDVRATYITVSHLLVHLAIPLFPLFLLFFPQYEASGDAFYLIALTVVLYTNAFGYAGLMVARGREKPLGRLALRALMLNLAAGYLLTAILHVPLAQAILGTMASYLLYVVALGFAGRRLLGMPTTFSPVVGDVLPLRLMAPFFLSLALIFLNAPQAVMAAPFILFAALNFKMIHKIKESIYRIIVNPDFINI